jgi:hypothetical protein
MHGYGGFLTEYSVGVCRDLADFPTEYSVGCVQGSGGLLIRYSFGVCTSRLPIGYSIIGNHWIMWIRIENSIFRMIG